MVRSLSVEGEKAVAAATTAELARLSELIDTIYQGATDPTRWDVALPAIANWVGASKGLLFTPLNAPDDGGFYFNHAIPEKMMQLWGTQYHAKDIWSARSLEQELLFEGSIINCDEIVPFNELQQSEFYQDFLSKHDVAHSLSCIVFGMDSPQSMPTVACSLFRDIAKGAYTTSECGRLSILVPHLSRALGVMTRLGNLELKAAASLAALDRLNAGALLLRADGVVGFANRAARRILEDEDGLKLRHLAGNSALGQVIAEDGKTQGTLSAAISSAVSPDVLHTAHFSRAVIAPRPSGRQPYTLNFSSLAAHNEFGTSIDAPRAIAFITDSAEPIRLDAELMKKTYGLTTAETRVAEALAECLTVDETADRLSLSRSTVKAHQESIYEKTSTNSRAKLMRLLMSLSQVG